MLPAGSRTGKGRCRHFACSVQLTQGQEQPTRLSLQIELLKMKAAPERAQCDFSKDRDPGRLGYSAVAFQILLAVCRAEEASSNTVS